MERSVERHQADSRTRDNNKKENIQKKQMIIFFLVAFGLNYLMGLGIYLGKARGVDVNSFPAFQMLTPALGTILALWLTVDDKASLPKASFGVYIVFSALVGLVCWIPIFNQYFDAHLVSTALVALGGVAFFIGLLFDKENKRLAFNLNPVNPEKTLAVVGLFLVLYLARMAAVTIPMEGMDVFLSYFQPLPAKVLALVMALFNFLLSYLIFFGEEYGWRYFLQPILQKKFGMVPGLFILGLVWGVWHLPLNLFYYSAEGLGLLSLVNQIVLCICYSMFIGFAYSYARSIWAPVLIHYFNNNMVLFFVDIKNLANPDLLQNQDYTWEMVASLAIANIIFFGVFILAKRNRDMKYRVPTANERIDYYREELVNNEEVL